METRDAIRGRRSIRKYEDRPVADELVREVLAAGMSAPTAKDQRTWHFHVVRDRAVLGRVADFHGGAVAAREAAAGILVCHEVALEQMPGFWVQDLAAATQNMLLAAYDLGLGSVWISAYPVESLMAGFRDLCSLPEGMIPFAMVLLGYPGENPAPRETFLADRVH